MKSRFFVLLFLLFSCLHAKDLAPFSKYRSVGFVNDFVVHEGLLYVGSDMGSVDIFDIQNTKIVNQILLPPLTSSMNRIIPADVLSVDCRNSKVLILSVGENGYRNVWIYENYMLKQIVDEKKKLLIKEARFVSDEQILLATMDSDLILYDTSEKYALYHSHISQSVMGDITLSDDMQKVIFCDESGEVKIIDTQSSQETKRYSSQNVDHIFKVAYSKDVVITAGQDRRVGVYIADDEAYHFKTDFLVYCVGITPSAKTAVYSSGQESTLQLFDVKTREKKERLIGHKNMITQVKFVSDEELFSSGRDNYVLRWIIK